MPVTLTIDSREIAAVPEKSIFDHAEQLDVRVPTSCFKQGKCRECLVEVLEGMDLLTPPSDEEAHLEENFRLSCRTHVAATEGRVRCHTLRRAPLRIQEGGLDVAGDLEIDPAVTRDGDRVLLDGVEIAQSPGPLLGLAVDIGTTTVVMRLVDLETGNVLAVQSFENPQRFGGSDIMARIKYDGDHKGRLLRRTLLGYLNHAIEDLPCDPTTIYEMVVVGNSTMRDIFFGLDVQSIGQKPYRSLTEHDFREGKVDTTQLCRPARTFRFPIHPEARVVGLPLVSGHVGADTAACMLAIGIENENRTFALMDIGTNTELLLGNGERVMAASCPAGPAFEGGKLSCGMPGLDGAIERVGLDDTGRPDLTVIGDQPPVGICGSGLIDLVSELLRIGRLDTMGRFTAEDETVFTLDPTQKVYLTEPDIGELAQAKAANASGLHIVFEHYGIAFEDVDVFYLAGGFARHIDVEAAKRIGLVPDIPSAKIVQIGNAAILGATRALVSMRERESLEKTVRRIEHVELEQNPHFFDYFVEGCQFVRIQRLDPEAFI
jgi:uncharacterized 2Fe-2S/4Fe-4S cluster protein (DUF4445 family)